MSIVMMGLFSGLLGPALLQWTTDNLVKGQGSVPREKLCSSKVLYIKNASLHPASFFWSHPCHVIILYLATREKGREELVPTTEAANSSVYSLPHSRIL